MAVLLDTSAVVLLMRRSPPPETSGLREAALQAAESGRALLSQVPAATAVFLGLPLLTWDSDFARAKSEAAADAREHDQNDPGRSALDRLLLHPASRGHG